jgi:Ca-activated chloride channel homolog
MKTYWRLVALCVVCVIAAVLAGGCGEVNGDREFSARVAKMEHEESRKMPAPAPLTEAAPTASATTVSAPQPAAAVGEQPPAAPAPNIQAPIVAPPNTGFNTESYDTIVETPFLAARQNPFSTFSIDVDTASYALVRRFLKQGLLPPPGAVRIEELVNYFPYHYSRPTGDVPFSVNVELADCPWNAKLRLARIALKGRDVHQKERPASNLVFLIDVSGSMGDENKLPLVKSSLKMLVDRLGEADRVAIVVYASDCGILLPSTSAIDRTTIVSAIDSLSAHGSTNAGDGIQLAYRVAVQNFIAGGANRIILCTDGDFNVGITDQSELVRLIEEKAKSGVFLTVLGFGMGNYKDSTMEKLADKGNGNYAYIDTENEARKVLVEQLSGTLVTIAKDVKIQIDFNPARAAGYRLIGYENRLLRAEDFKDDAKDAGEIGAGHTVTAFYEVVPAGQSIPGLDVDPSKYQSHPELSEAAGSAELFTVRLRYKNPDGNVSKPLAVPVVDTRKPFDSASEDFRFAASVAEFGMLLRDPQHRGSTSWGGLLEAASSSLGADKGGYRAQFLELVKAARRLKEPGREVADVGSSANLGFQEDRSYRQPQHRRGIPPERVAHVVPPTFWEPRERHWITAENLMRLLLVCLLALVLLRPDRSRNREMLERDPYREPYSV